MVYEVRFVGYEITGGHCEYTIHVIGGPEEGTWQFSRRYASMRNFHDQIRPLGGNRVPAFPPKKLFGNLKASFIEARRVQLEQYFQALQNIPDVSNSREFKQYLSPPDKNFLERPKPTLNQRINQPPSPKTQAQVQEELKHVYEQITEEISAKYIDLANQANPLEDDDVRKKQAEYQNQLAHNKVSSGLKVPQGQQGNFALLDEPLAEIIHSIRDQITEVLSIYHEVSVQPLPLIKDINVSNN